MSNRERIGYTVCVTNKVFAMCNIQDKQETQYETFSLLMNDILKVPNVWCYLFQYNLNKYSGMYIKYLEDHDFKYVSKPKKELKENEYTTVITGSKWFSIAFNYNKHRKVIYDSKKLLPSHCVEEIEEAFKSDGTQAKSLAYALSELSNVVDIYNSTLSKATFKKVVSTFAEPDEKYREFPKKWKSRYVNKIDIDLDSYLRPAFKGGALYCKPGTYQNIKKIDVNSMYSSVLKEESLPYGKPIFYRHIHTLESLQLIPYKCYIVEFRVNARLKSNMFPVLCKRDRTAIDGKVKLVSACNYTDVWMLPSPTFELFLRHYKYDDLEILNVIAFKSDKGAFDGIVDELYSLKVKYSKENDACKRLIYKICLNSFIGRFGLHRQNTQQKANIDESGEVKLTKGETIVNDGVYLPLAIFINDYAKARIITAAQTIGFDRVINIDTDCLLYIGEKKLPHTIIIDEYKLGAFKNEGCYPMGKFLGARGYMLIDNDNKPIVKYCGLDLSARNTLMTLDDFKPGKEINTLRLSIINGEEIWKVGKVTIKLEENN